MKDTQHPILAAGAFCVLACALLLSGCKSASPQDKAHAAKETFVRPGTLAATALLPQSAAATPSLQNGMLLAQETLNAQGGVLGYPLNIRFVLVGPDDPEGADALKAALEKKPSVLWVAGDLAVYVGPELIEEPVLTAFLSEYPPVPSLLPLGVRIYPNGPALCQNVFDVAHTTDITSVAVLYATNPVNKSLASYLAFLMQGDGIRVYTDQFSTGETKFDMIADYLKRSDIDAVYLIGPAPDCDRLIATLDKTGYPHPILAVFPEPPNDDALPALKARLLYPVPEAPLDPTFVEAYRRRFNKAPDRMAAYGYENVIRIAAAAQASHARDPELIRKALLADKAAYAIPGLTFEKDGDTSVPLALHVPAGIKLPPRIPPRVDNMMQKQEGPILLLDPYEPIKTQ